MRNHDETKPSSVVTSAKTALTPREQTVMSNPSQPYLPPEILDYAVDFLHNDQNTLKQCCLTSKSWIPRTRKHLFAEVVFQSVANLESWKQTFPDNSDSPAFYTHTLLIGCLEVVVIADAGEDGWIRAFSRVTALELHANRTSILSGYPSFSLTPFHGFSPVLKYLSVICGPASNPQVFELICTLPLLENLLLSDDGLYGDSYFNSGAFDSPTVVQDSPLLTGCLFLQVYGGIDDPARRLLCLPNGLRFETLVLSWLRERETQWANALIAGCSDTLRNLTVSPCVNRAFVSLLLYDTAAHHTLQFINSRLMSTSQKQQNSDTYAFSSRRRSLGGSFGLSNP